MAMWTNDTDIIVYEGWIPVAEPGYYCYFVSGPSIAVFGGDIFRDDMYYCYMYVLNWDMMYNGSSGERIGDDQCRMSMLFYDNETDSIEVLQDFYPGDDDAHYVNTDGRNVSDDPTWENWNTSTFWTLFSIDTTITGTPLADPEDPPGPAWENYPAVEQTIVIVAIPCILVAYLMFLILTGNLTVETLLSLMIIVILAVVTIYIIMQ
jgi:hypothetical protein